MTILYTDLAVIIPAYNEQEKIAEIIKQVNKYAKPIIVDDCSTDNTKTLAEQNGAIVIKHDENKGYDHSLLTGLKSAIEYNFKYAITMDADGQHDPNYINEFYSELKKNNELVIGIRNEKQRWAESVFSFFSKTLWGIEDPLCGMKAYNLNAVKKIKDHYSFKFIGTELALTLIMNNIKYSQIHILISERTNGESRYGIGIIPNIKIITSLLFNIFKLIRYKLHI